MKNIFCLLTLCFSQLRATVTKRPDKNRTEVEKFILASGIRGAVHNSGTEVKQKGMAVKSSFRTWQSGRRDLRKLCLPGTKHKP